MHRRHLPIHRHHYPSNQSCRLLMNYQIVVDMCLIHLTNHRHQNLRSPARLVWKFRNMLGSRQRNRQMRPRRHLCLRHCRDIRRHPCLLWYQKPKLAEEGYTRFLDSCRLHREPHHYHHQDPLDDHPYNRHCPSLLN